MEEIFKLVSTYGFPMVLSVYLLLRFEPLIKELKNSIDTLIMVTNLQHENKLKDISKYKNFN
ncbi:MULTISPECIES: YvrJ family protein [unclassified Halanaerobium]|uniref:YvrJ family protein n=1 Tax=unclassified Halanaerobium TaxID=2641197 RepID=UPI000DF339E2|nr:MULTISPECIES: YvrJ family protein [unclassified Halanaerobium]RCW44738.1 YvrJ-like protein [Halanaerobium sp. MA284_MarDTE_T2]RCW78356.1 YvrJ-like protein [Halanaerobium sp. DL-01]